MTAMTVGGRIIWFQSALAGRLESKCFRDVLTGVLGGTHPSVST